MSDNVSNKIMVYFVALFGKLSLAALSIYGTTVVCLSTSFLRRMNMKAARLVAGFVCGALCLAAFSGCETRQSACEREKRLTERMDEMQMDLDARMMDMGSEMAAIRSNPVIVQQSAPAAYTPEPVATPVDSIAIDDSYNYSKAEQLRDLAQISREQQLYPSEPAPRPRASASSRGNIRVPVPARTVQAALKEAGHYTGNIDGKVGPKTIQAITSFQRSQGLKADGIVGRATWQNLQAFVPAGMSTARMK